MPTLPVMSSFGILCSIREAPVSASVEVFRVSTPANVRGRIPRHEDRRTSLFGAIALKVVPCRAATDAAARLQAAHDPGEILVAAVHLRAVLPVEERPIRWFWP